MTPSGPPETVGVVMRRAGLLEELVEVPARKPELVERLDVSRSTIDRAIRALESEGFVERTRAGYTTTPAGRIAVARYRQFAGEQEAILGAREVLEWMPDEIDPPVELVTDASIETEAPAAELFDRLADQLDSAELCRVVLPTLSDTRLLRLCHAETLRGDLDIELLAGESLLARLETEFSRLSRELVEHGDVDVQAAETSIGLLLFGSGQSAEQPGTLVVIVYEDREIQGLLVSSNATALHWANSYYERCRESGTDCTDRLQSTQSSQSLSRITEDRLPAKLRAEGFVRVDEAYLDRREPLPPATAWRAGLGLSEVAAGHAVDRSVSDARAGAMTADTDGGSSPVDRPAIAPSEESGSPINSHDQRVIDGEPEREQSLSDQVRDTLRSGTDCALLGPPGSGKSTVAKQVAIDWVEHDHGQVLYREAGAGRAIEATALLEDVLDRMPEPVLVVVEDAVRPEADAIFEVMLALSGRDDVVFLLDAREQEWTKPPRSTSARQRTYRQEAVETIALPELTETQCRALVARAEAIVNEDLAVPVETLLADLQDGATGQQDRHAGTMLLLFDRLARAFEPLSTDHSAPAPTRLDDVIDRSRTTLAELGDAALDVGVLVHLLNAADIPITPAYLYAPSVATSSGDRPSADRLATIRAALDQLDGSVLLNTGADSSRTVHSSWSVRFLERLLDADEVETRQRFARCVTAVLSLADDPDQRDAVRSLTGADDALAAIEGAPRAWADDTVTSLVECFERHAQLSPLLRGASPASFDLPAACSAATTLEQLQGTANCLRAAGEHDRARERFERLETRAENWEHPQATRYRIESLLGQADLARRRSAYDDARSILETALELATEAADRQLEGRCRFQLGLVARSTESFDDALTRFQQCWATFRELGATKREADALRRLGEVRAMRAELSYGTPGSLETAIENLEASLACYRSLGDRRGRADARRWLGQVRTLHPEEDPRAACQEHRVVVNLARQLGDRDREARALYALGDAWFVAGELSRARAQFERALAMFADSNRTAWTIIVRRHLGILFMLDGALDRSRDILETALDEVASIDRPEMTIRLHRATAMCHLYAHEPDAAMEQARAALDRAEALADGTHIVRACQSLGRAQLLAGDVDAAADTATRLRAAARAHDIEIAPSSLVAPVALVQGDYETAREHAIRGLEGPEPEGRYPLVLARIALATGEIEEARRRCTEVIEEQYGDEHRYWTQHALLDRARVHRHDDAIEAAEADLEEARDRLQEYPYPLLAARVALQRGALAREQGSLDRAETLLQRAETHCNRLGSPRLLSRVQFEQAQLLLIRGNRDAARSFLETAVERARCAGASQQEARLLAALLETQADNEGNLEQYRERYQTLECDHLPVHLRKMVNSPGRVRNASQPGAGQPER
jgi:tetratricopeptide (TPR) repeat protein/predicted transcriptional regulator